MFESAICQIMFYVFAVLALICAIGVIAFRNPVTSAMNMALCFGFVAAIFFGMGAQFLGIVQLIVYSGAILVLFLFVVMMLDVDAEGSEEGSAPACKCLCGTVCCWLRRRMPCIGAALVVGLLAGAMVKICISLPGATDGSCPCKTLCDNVSALCIGSDAAATEATAPAKGLGAALPALSPAATSEDAKLIGHTLFGPYIIPFVILGFALLSGTVGAVALSRKIRKD